MVLSYRAVMCGQAFTSALILATSLSLGTMSALADYTPPKLVPYDDLVAATKEVMGRPSIPTTGANGNAYVDDIFRVKAAGMDWDIGLGVFTPTDPNKIARGADGKKIGIFLLHGGSGDFKSMHLQAAALSEKFGYKVVTMSFPGRHYLQDAAHDWPGNTVERDGSVRTPIWVKDEKLRLNPETKRWEFSQPDWEEFHQVIRGNGPLNKQRVGLRRFSYEQGEWVRRAVLGQTSALPPARN